MKNLCTLWLVAFSTLLLSGCGDPSKDDVCAPCQESDRSECEQAYDLCSELADCALEDLKQAYAEKCG